MAITFRVKIDRQTGGAYQASLPRTINNTQAVTFSVLIYDDGGAVLNPADFTEHDIYDLWELPIVNRTLFLTQLPDDTYALCPWLICSNKVVERDTGNLLLFHVTCQYTTGSRAEISEADLAQIEVPATVATYPFLTENVWAGEERVIFEEATSGGSSSLVMRLPTGNLYSEPFKRTWPKRAMRQTQYEDYTTDTALFNNIEDRLFSVCDTNGWEGNGEGTWMITNIDYQRVTLPTLTGGNEILKVEGVLMQYTIERNLNVGGWQDWRGLVDTHYLEVANNLGTKKPNRDPFDKTTIIPGLINPDGTKQADQSAAIQYAKYKVQPEQNFPAFLRTNP